MKRKYERPQIKKIHIEISNMVMKSPDKTIENPFEYPKEEDADGACAKDYNNYLWE